MTRIDRIYTNIFTSTLIDLSPHTKTLWDPRAHNSTTSDHIPIKSQLNPKVKNSNTLPTIPSWVSKHPSYPTTINQLLNTIKHIPQHDYTKHQYHKDIMYEASRQIIRNAKNASDTTEQRQYWTLAAFRHSHMPDHPLLQRALQAYTTLQQYFYQHVCTDKRRLHQHLQELTTQLTTERAHALNNHQHNHPHDETTKKRTNNLLKRQSKWSNKKKRAYTLHITTDNGHRTTNTHETAQALHDYWAPKFQEATTSPTLTAKYILPHVQTIDPDLYDWTATYDNMVDFLARQPDTAPGPDGIRYSGWHNAPQTIKDELYRQYLNTLQHNNRHIDDNFNVALLLFPPKGNDPADNDDTYSRKPKDTRPISLSNTDNKTTSTLFNHTATQIAQNTVSAEQACLEGRQMGDNIIDIESKALTFAIQHSPLGGIAAFDISAAFPSISRLYIFRILRTMGLPQHFIDGIKKLYHNNLHYIFINNMVSYTILFTITTPFGSKTCFLR